MRKQYWLQVVLIFLLSACSITSQEEATEEPYYAPDFTIESLDGSSYTLSDLRGQVVIVNFWATWCVPCREEMPELQLIAETYADELIVLGINQRESVDLVQEYIQEIGVSFPILINPPDDVLLNYQVMNLPQTLIVAPDGELVYRQFGALNFDEFSEILESL